MSDSERPLRKGSDDSVDTFTSSESYSHRRDRRHGDERHRRQGTREDYESDKERRRRRDRDRGRGRQDSHTSDRRDRDRHREKDRGHRRHDSYDSEEDARERRRERRQRKRDRRERREREERERERADRSHGSDDNENPFASSYDEKPSRTARDREFSKDPKSSPKRGNTLELLIVDEEKAEPQPSDRHLTKLERFGGPWIYIVPLLASFCLLAASTCSSDWWRKDVNVIRLGLPGDIYARLLATGSSLGKGGGEGTEVASSGGQVAARAATISPQGWLSVGFWGWCVGPEGDGPYVLFDLVDRS